MFIFINRTVKERQVLPKPLMQQKQLSPYKFFHPFLETTTMAFVWDFEVLGVSFFVQKFRRLESESDQRSRVCLSCLRLQKIRES